MKFFTPLVTAPVPSPLIDNWFMVTLKELTSDRVWSYKQRAAVKTWEEPIKDPPHKEPFKYKRVV